MFSSREQSKKMATNSGCRLGVPALAYTGVITDTMCGAKHSMGITPDDKCVRECVKMDPKDTKNALLVGKEVYVPSDQEATEKFAAQNVTYRPVSLDPLDHKTRTRS